MKYIYEISRLYKLPTKRIWLFATSDGSDLQLSSFENSKDWNQKLVK